MDGRWRRILRGEADVAIQQMQNDSDLAASTLKLELARLDLASYQYTCHPGLDIVRAVADEWGIDGDQTSRIIWARFDCPE